MPQTLRSLAVLPTLVALPLWLMLAACGERGKPAVAGPAPHEVAFREHVQPVLGDYCLGCHGGAEPEGGLSFEAQVDDDLVPGFEELRERTAFYERLTHHLMNGSMPPEGEFQPKPEQRDAVVSWFTDTIAEAWRVAPPNPGRVTMRRLNRVEYRNTVRDLLGVDYDTTKTFPTDDVGYGFDHIGDVLSMSPILMEKYLDAAEEIAARTIVEVPPPVPYLRRFEAEAAKVLRRDGTDRGFVRFASPGAVTTPVAFPRTARYRIRVRARADQAGPDRARVRVHVAGHKAEDLIVDASTGTTIEVERVVSITLGTRALRIGFPNDYYNPKHPDPTQRDRNLYVDWVEVEGPLAGTVKPMPEPYRRVMVCEPVEGEERGCAEQILGRLLKAAFRRPPSSDELQRHVGLVFETMAAGESFAGGIQTALLAILVAPEFLFRVELDEGTGGDIRPLDEYELASRLSYFLWASCPDEALLAAADAGVLRTTIHEHVERMLADKRARSLVTNFASQWLELRRLDTSVPDPRRFKGFSDALRGWMRQETELFVEAIMREDRSILDLIDAPFTYLNQPLAEHYKIKGVEGGEFRRVDLVDRPERAGLLGHASILTLTSYPHRTSPVLRGKWVMDELLGTAPPPPPPGVGTLEAQSPELLKLSVRERLAVHRADPACAVCHDSMDNLGYGLENFDAVGVWRTRDGMAKLDASGVLPGGHAFQGPAELKQILRADPGVPRCFAEKLLTYALGRGLEPYDRPAILQIVREAKERRLRFRAFVHAIVATDAFTMRRTAGDSR